MSSTNIFRLSSMFLLLSAGCTVDFGRFHIGADAGSDAGLMRIGGGDDAGADAGADARVDAGTDAGMHASTTPFCGDEEVDEGEECDDGNGTSADGCEPVTCKFSCTTDIDCRDTNQCNGAESCHPDTHACISGTPNDNGASCENEGTTGTCRAELCIRPGCGNNEVAGTEECDDGANGDDSDGCRDDCTYVCTQNADCTDNVFCNGGETCDTTTHLCVAGAAPSCDDLEPCTIDSCDVNKDSCATVDLDDGTVCDNNSICLSGECNRSVCGDGYIDTWEECEDGNGTSADGCEPVTCKFSCTSDIECRDTNQCNGAESCYPDTHACISGTPNDNGTSCESDGTTGTCRAELCIRPDCGNNEVAGTEECDDGANGDDGDGCRDDCTYVCTQNADCTDNLFCNGGETCDTTTHLCVAGAAPSCDDLEPCTIDSCNVNTDRCATADLDDGTVCDNNSICLSGECDASVCGDGYIDSWEDCEDGNLVSFDGCEPATCAWTCAAAVECTAANAARCDLASHVCESCRSNSDCAGTTGTTCFADACVTPSGGGGSCNSTQPCISGLLCTAAGICSAGGAGDVCAQPTDCASGFDCSIYDECRAEGEHGTSCNSPGDCDSGLRCSAGNVCGNPIIQLVTGYVHTCVLTSDGTVTCMGQTVPDGLRDVVRIDAAPGGQTTCATKSNDEVVCWGLNNNGQVSNAPTGTVSEIRPDYTQMCYAADRTQKYVYCHGADTWGQVSETPEKTAVQFISTSYTHNCAITATEPSNVICWGSDNDGGTVPLGLGLTDVRALDTNDKFSCAIKSNSTLVCWDDAEITSGDVAFGSLPTGTVRAMSLDDYFGCAITSNDAIECWTTQSNASFNYGQLDPPATTSAVMIVVGFYHACAVVGEDVTCWGAGEPGNGGFPHYGQSTVPAGLSNVKALSLGGYHSCAITSDDGLACWDDGTRAAADPPLDLL